MSADSRALANRLIASLRDDREVWTFYSADEHLPAHMRVCELCDRNIASAILYLSSFRDDQIVIRTCCVESETYPHPSGFTWFERLKLRRELHDRRARFLLEKMKTPRKPAMI